jgi:hypothetical protein
MTSGIEAAYYYVSVVSSIVKVKRWLNSCTILFYMASRKG